MMNKNAILIVLGVLALGFVCFFGFIVGLSYWRMRIVDELTQSAQEILALQQNFQVAQNMDDMALRAKSLDDLGLDAATRKCLDAAGIASVGELTAKTEAELLKLPGFDRVMLEDVTIGLSTFGLRLGTRPPAVESVICP